MKFNVKKTYNRIKHYYEFKAKHKDLTSVVPSQVKHIFMEEVLQVMPQRDPQGRRVFIINVGSKFFLLKFRNKRISNFIRISGWDPSKQSMEDLFRTIQLTVNFMLLEPMSQVSGGVGIVNYDGLGFSHIVAIKISLIPVIMEFAQNVMPIRIGGAYIVNNSYLFNILFQIMKPFLEGELKENLHIEGSNFENIVKAIGGDILEKRFGGKLENGIPYGKEFYKIMESHISEIEGRS